MVGLLDIVNVPETVMVREVPVPVHGVSVRGIAHLMTQFPEIREVLGGRQVDVTPELLVNRAPRAIAAVIAAGCGMPGDPQAEEVAAGLGVDEQLELITAIIRKTLPGGLSPFLKRLESLTKGLGAPGAQLKEAGSS